MNAWKTGPDNQPVPVLRPLGTVDLLDVAIRLYQRSFGPLLGIIAVVYVPAAVMQITAVFLMFGRNDFAQSLEHVEKLADLNWATLIPGAALIGLAFLIYVLALPISQGALAIAVSRRYLGQPISVSDAYRTVGGRWGEVLAASLLVGLATSAGLLLCLVPGIYWGTMWLLVPAAIVIEGRPIRDALQRSWDLVRGEWWRCFGTMLLLSVVTQAAAGLIVWPVSALSAVLFMDKNPLLGQALNQSLSLAAGVLIQPVQIIGIVLLYYDLRIRKEGFDLDLLARNLGTTPALVTPVAPLVTPPPPGTVPLPPKIEPGDALGNPSEGWASPATPTTTDTEENP